MKKLLVLVCLALAFTACFGSVSALAAEEPAAEPQNLLNFEAADFGKNFYDSSLGEVMIPAYISLHVWIISRTEISNLLTELRYR